MRGIKYQIRQGRLPNRLLTQILAAFVIDPTFAAALWQGFGQGFFDQMRIGRNTGGVDETGDTVGFSSGQQTLGPGDICFVLCLAIP
jgi:hypothetical protein